jgi:hypothetical protein
MPPEYPRTGLNAPRPHRGTRRARPTPAPPSLGSFTEETEKEVAAAPAPPPRTSHTLSKRDAAPKTPHGKTRRQRRTKGGPVLGYTPSAKYPTIAEGGRRRRTRGRKSKTSKRKRGKAGTRKRRRYTTRRQR